jgi:hypothetical protein
LINASGEKSESLMDTEVSAHGVSGSTPATSTKVSKTFLGTNPCNDAGFKRFLGSVLTEPILTALAPFCTKSQSTVRHRRLFSPELLKARLIWVSFLFSITFKTLAKSLFETFPDFFF